MKYLQSCFIATFLPVFQRAEIVSRMTINACVELSGLTYFIKHSLKQELAFENTQFLFVEHR